MWQDWQCDTPCALPISLIPAATMRTRVGWPAGRWGGTWRELIHPSWGHPYLPSLSWPTSNAWGSLAEQPGWAHPRLIRNDKCNCFSITKFWSVYLCSVIAARANSYSIMGILPAETSACEVLSADTLKTLLDKKRKKTGIALGLKLWKVFIPVRAGKYRIIAQSH